MSNTNSLWLLIKYSFQNCSIKKIQAAAELINNLANGMLTLSPVGAGRRAGTGRRTPLQPGFSTKPGHFRMAVQVTARGLSESSPKPSSCVCSFSHVMEFCLELLVQMYKSPDSNSSNLYSRLTSAVPAHQAERAVSKRLRHRVCAHTVLWWASLLQRSTGLYTAMVGERGASFLEKGAS